MLLSNCFNAAFVPDHHQQKKQRWTESRARARAVQRRGRGEGGVRRGKRRQKMSDVCVYDHHWAGCSRGTWARIRLARGSIRAAGSVCRFVTDGSRVRSSWWRIGALSGIDSMCPLLCCSAACVRVCSRWCRRRRGGAAASWPEGEAGDGEQRNATLAGQPLKQTRRDGTDERKERRQEEGR